MAFDLASKVGESVGGWLIESFSGYRGGRANFTGSKNGESAWIQLVADADERNVAATAWALAGQLSHNHLLPVLDAGEAVLDEMQCGYAVYQKPDDDVAAILGERSLDPDEARAFTTAAASALSYLHRQALCLGDVTPPNTFIVGESVKFGIGTVRQAGADGLESDVRQLGEMLLRGLSGTDNPDAVRRLPQPFGKIAAGCLGMSGPRWTADRVLEALEGRALKEETPAAVPEIPTESMAKSRRGLITAAAAGVLGIAAFLFYWNSAETRTDPAPKSAVTVPAPDRAPVPAPAQGAAPVPDTRPSPFNHAKARTSIPETTADRIKTPARGGAEVWAVIAATYANFGAAEGRAKKIAAQSGLSPHVYPPAGRGSLYFVVLGSKLTQDAAERLLRSAREKGAPRDSYVTKLNEDL